MTSPDFVQVVWESVRIIALMSRVRTLQPNEDGNKFGAILRLPRKTRKAQMTFDPQSLSLRPVSTDDEAFLLKVFRSSRGDDLRGLGWDEERIGEFLEMQYQAQQQFHGSEYKRAHDEIVLLAGQPAGRLIVERREYEIRCIDVALLPEHRNAGIGAFLIRELQDEAKRENKPLRLQVIRFNRAVNLFERSGFVRTSETGTHFQMEWKPRGSDTA
jgi:GNAT superfamily N-acetyltransferase